MQVAKIVNSAIASVETLSLSPRYENSRWWDLSDETTRQQWMTKNNYKEVVEVERPLDTDSYVYSITVKLSNGVPLQVWTKRDLTEQEKDLKKQLADAKFVAQQNQALWGALIYLSSNSHEDGGDWVQPTGAHDAYPVDITVKHDGKTWKSLTAFNVWTPGGSAWRDISPGGDNNTVADWIRPTGAHDAYPLDYVVLYNGKKWISTTPANVWEPGVYGWKEA